ncbi:MAG: rRNA methyltransferase [Nitriliruptor sp.]|nr:MAG: rRNA methyltransferase [Nitriliruptor sp.]
MAPAYDSAEASALVDRVVAWRRDPAWVVLEGAHALKHALRFRAQVEVVLTPDRAALLRLLAALAPDVETRVGTRAVELDATAWRRVAPRELPSPALAVARRPAWTPSQVAAAAGRVLVLEGPRHLGNLGAAVRVAAAADAGGVLVLGDADPWHPTAVRAAAGLQFALPVARTDELPTTDRPVIGLDVGGRPLHAAPLPEDALVVVGTERGGLSPALRARADDLRAIEMRDGVASLNLATAVAVALYADR